MKQVRIKDIAQKAGVSIGTVDRVLHNRGEVAPDTRERVLTIAREMHYQPNIVAQALTTKKQYHLAALLPRGGNENVFWMAHPQGIEKAVKDLRPFYVDVRFFFFELHNEADFLAKTKEIHEYNPEGVIFAPILKKESIQFCSELDSRNTPYIFIDTYIENANCISFIGEDAYQGGRVAASLIDYGLEPSKDILIVNIAKDLENTQHLNRRNQGFMSYFLDTGRNLGMKITVEIPSSDKETVKSRMDYILKSNPNIGAILVSSAKTHVIARYLEDQKLNNLILVGYELTRKNIDYLKRGLIRFLIGQKPTEQTEKAVKRMFEYLTTNQTVGIREFQPVEIVNVENVDLFQ
ncbi:LacI family DNA-binding transcriptional regulator [Alkalitalea saponilacus]|uniref:LacI family transcriptional regulator n=1 Tax=Alkalitalea saponilacus TaxID=889453 RepID=A0A1T5G6V2_9BACT|nr:LacI family DNA-binding transcriptional regulator [Alkalitalea saponilacus]ASB47874.1 LacI family transcriptional regulator [Alkalitalea saponilacus]SKC04071.1 LacI family transcriptional regulator [Alkalitalea saponilacus]